MSACFTKGCKADADCYVTVHGLDFSEHLMACDNKDHFRDAQRFLRRRLRREKGVKQPAKNKAKGRSR